jgi:peptidoglycan/xylan/chitin deacetylase (PgdA/CDA1 family)
VRRTISVSVDLDPLACYFRIHALGRHPAALTDVVLRHSVPRYLEVLGARGIRATFFVVGADLEAGAPGAVEARALVRALAEAGHELGNHSLSHPYDLARLTPEAIDEEIRAAHELVSEHAGARVVGFRAPGYDVSGPMLASIASLGYLYDSSIFPAPGYYAAKALVMAGLRLAGRKSGAVLTDPMALVAPADPYRPDPVRPWRRGQATVVELPIAVTPFLRLPAIGTNLLLFPRWLRDLWLDRMRGRPHFNLELHGIDLCDAEEDGLPPALIARQPDLRVPLAKKRRAFEELLDRLAGEGRFVPLAEAAREVQRSGAIE